MRIKQIRATEIPPIISFEAENLSDLVVIGGANGAGKTRLLNAILAQLQNLQPDAPVQVVLAATCDDERRAWNKDSLDTANNADAQLLQATLQMTRRRNNMKSTVLNFESNRTFQQVKPLQFAFEFPDPMKEAVSWNMSFQGLSGRAQDTQHTILKRVQGEQNRIAKRAMELKDRGETSMDLNFDDPLEIFRSAFSSLLSPKELDSANLQQQKLYYKYKGDKLSLDTLSSGEREVINIAFDFIIRNPNDSIIIFDEPELHLHPELVQKLIRTLAGIGSNNQFIYSTHSPNVISASLENSVIFVAPPREDGGNQAVAIDTDDATQSALRSLGHSVGVIALGNKVVFIEGEEASLDKEVYSTITKEHFPDFVLVPSGSKESIINYSVATQEILDKTIWGIEFFMICDRDAAPTNLILGGEEKAHPNLKVLSRYHLENFFLDETVLAKVFQELEPPDSWLRSPEQIRDKLKELAREIVSYSVALRVSSQFRFDVGNIDIMARGAHALDCDELKYKLIELAKDQTQRVTEALSKDLVATAVEDEFFRLVESLDEDTEIWKRDLPGRILLKKFATAASMNYGQLKRAYIAKARTHGYNPLQEIIDIFSGFETARDVGRR